VVSSRHITDTDKHIHISLKTVTIGRNAHPPTLVWLLETLARDVCKKVPYGFPGGNGDLPDRPKSTPE
jgi:hypothetical protein